jgi:hypothetical protein
MSTWEINRSKLVQSNDLLWSEHVITRQRILDFIYIRLLYKTVSK